MIKNVVLAAVLSTAAVFSLAQAPASQPMVPAGAAPVTTVTPTPQPMAAAQTAMPVKKHHAKRHAKKKASKSAAHMTN